MILRRLAAACAVLPLCLAACARDNPADSAAKPLNRDIDRHRHFLTVVEKGEGDVIFIGDSITQGWEDHEKLWADAFGAFKPVNLGISGDQTGHVLWRVTAGKEIDPLKPRLAVLMIGTNNIGVHSAEQIADGVKVIVETLRAKKPDMKILVLGLFPRGDGIGADAPVCPAEKLNPKVRAVNAIISQLADDKTIFYEDIGGAFLNKDGGLERKIMPDLLHLSPEGYKIWADAIKDDVAKLAK